MNNTIAFSLDLAHLMVTGAARYHMGRHTIAVHGFCSDLAAIVDELEPKTIEVLKRDISQWLDDNPTCEFAGVDDRRPWEELLEVLGK